MKEEFWAGACSLLPRRGVIIMNEQAKIIQKMTEGHPAPWALYEADPALLTRASEDPDFLYEVMSTFRREMDTDGDGFTEFEKLFDLYRRTNEDYKMMIDAVFVHLCGWSLPTLLKKASGEYEDE